MTGWAVWLLLAAAHLAVAYRLYDTLRRPGHQVDRAAAAVALLWPLSWLAGLVLMWVERRRNQIGWW